MHPVEAAFARRDLPVATAPFSAVALRPLEGAATVLITALYYGYTPREGQNLARFAALPDYHRIVPGILEPIAEELRLLYPGRFFRAFTDNSPIDERKAAFLGGLGVEGRNRLCITEKGSFVFLGELITDAVIDLPRTPPERKCDRCGKCLAACPNGALTADGFHPERCLSYLTQKKGELTAEEQAAVRNSGIAWGCDRCAAVCPHNSGRPDSPLSRPPYDLLPTLTSDQIAGLSDREYREKYADRAFAWRGKAPMARNLNLLEEKHG